MNRRDQLLVWILGAVLVLGLGATAFVFWLVGATTPPAPLPEPQAASPESRARQARVPDAPSDVAPAPPAAPQDTPQPPAPGPVAPQPLQPAPPPTEAAPPPPVFTPRPPAQSEEGDDIPPSLAPPRELRPQLETAHLDAQALARMFTSLLR